MADHVVSTDKCLCRAGLPMHLVDLMAKTTQDYDHVCSCGRVWRAEKQGDRYVFVHGGRSESNPFA